MKNKRNPITKAVKIALYSSVIASLSLSGIAYAADAEDDEDSVEIEAMQVTGSRIKRTDIEGSLPVTTIDREQIELSGENNAADLIRSLTFNSSGSFRTQSGSSAQGTASVSLRGIGSNRTLILIDGRRLPKTPLTGSNQDLNTIPLGAIEKIEVLSDGASAIYGSDAIGGVINIITRTNFSGAELMIGGQQVSLPNDGGDREEGHVIFGSSNDTSSIIGGISWNDSEIIFARDYFYNQIGSSTFSNNFRTVSASGGEVAGTDVAVLGGCDFPGTGFYILNPSDPNSRCAYDFTLESADESSIDNRSLFLKGKHDINEDWKIWANANVNKTSSFGRYAPVPDGSLFGVGTPLSAGSINNPSNPNSPNYDPANYPNPTEVHWRHRFDALGNRDSTVTTDLTSLEIGATGQVGKAEVEFGVIRTNNRTLEIGRNFLLRSAAAAAIENGSYLLQNPFAADAAVLNGLRVTTTRAGRYDQDTIFGSVAFDIFNLPEGSISTFIGVEHRKIKFEDRYDSLSEAGQVGGSSGSSAAGNREVDSVFFEAFVPLLEDLEMNLAGRFDDYSDFGSEFSPKISFRYQPLANLTLRASFGEGFRAPNLVTLTQQPSETADSIQDDPTCIAEGSPLGCETQINGTVISNSSLKPELSEQFSIGLAYEPTDWFNFTLDYFNIEITNEIRNFSSQNFVDDPNLGAGGPLGCLRDPATPANIAAGTVGPISSCIRGAANRGDLETSGIDLNGRFNYNALGVQAMHNIAWSHLLTQSLDGGRDLIEDPGTPANRITINNVFSYNNWTIGYNLNVIGDQADDTDNEVFIDGVSVSADKIGHVPTWVTHDLQLTYNTSWNGRITVGVNNLTEKIPPLGLGNTSGREYDFNLYDAYGRVSYLRYTQTF